MSYQAKWELLVRTAPRYQASDAKSKSQILDEFVCATGFHRKYAIVMLNNPPERMAKIRRPRARCYSQEAQDALMIAWAACNRVCSKRLVPYLPELVAVLEAHGHLNLTEQVRGELLSMSAATVDRILAPARKSPPALLMTKAGALLKRHVPIRTFTEWQDTEPGFVEADLVCHCGQSPHGSFVCTLTLTDIASGWTEPVALLRRSSQEVLDGIQHVTEVLPFQLRGLDVDNGSEFINDDVIQYCTLNEITFTRGRAYRKNDQCFVEQKNGAVVRRTVGHERYEGLASRQQLAELYSVLRLYVNLFQPSLKLASKARVGAKSTRTYAVARTPLQRLVAAKCLTPEQESYWLQLARTLDPVALLNEIQSLQRSLSAHACNRVTAGPAIGFVAAKPELLPLRAHLAKPPNPQPPAEPRRYGRFRSVQSELYAWFTENPRVATLKLLRRLQQANPGQYHDNDRSALKELLTEWRKLPPGSAMPVMAGRRGGRKGTFVAVERELRTWFEEDRGQSGTTLLHRLQKAYPGQFPGRTLRGLQRLLIKWRA
jgi:hypothetical protein